VFIWQDFGSGGAAGVTSVRRHQELLSCETEPVLDDSSSKTDLLLAKTESISDAGCASVIT